MAIATTRPDTEASMTFIQVKLIEGILSAQRADLVDEGTEPAAGGLAAAGVNLALRRAELGRRGPGQARRNIRVALALADRSASQRMFGASGR
jgi:hypothetical protein